MFFQQYTTTFCGECKGKYCAEWFDTPLCGENCLLRHKICCICCAKGIDIFGFMLCAL